MFLVSTLERNLTARRLLRSANDRRCLRPLLSNAFVDAAIKWLPILPAPVRVLVDVGAARGEVAAELNTLYGLTRAVLIEANAKQLEHVKDRKLAEQVDVFVCAAGRTAHTATFNILQSVDSSSLLPPKVKAAEAAFPGFGFEAAAKVTVQVRPLDDIVRECRLERIDLLKVDVQGAELEVFRGAGETLKRTRFIHSEIAFTSLYEGQPVFHEVYEYLRKDFELLGLSGVVCDRQGNPIQGDATFVNRRSF